MTCFSLEAGSIYRCMEVWSGEMSVRVMFEPWQKPYLEEVLRENGA